MSEHNVSIEWSRSESAEQPGTYSRKHAMHLNGGQSINVSASVEYRGDADCADPEQLLVGAVASCHMLTFLAIAEIQGFVVEQYDDKAIGYLEKTTGGLEVTRIELAPRAVFGGDKVPDTAQLDRIHASAHKNCFIGRSIKSEIVIAPRT